MLAKWNPVRDFLVDRILPVFNVAVFFLAVFDALVKILEWKYINLDLNADIHKILSLFDLSRVKVQFDYSGFSIAAGRVVIIACLLILLIKNKTVRRFNFWLASLPFLGIMLLAAWSRYWSVSIPLSETRYFYLAAVAVGGIYIGLECNRSTIIWLLEAISILIILGNFALVYKRPGFAIMVGPGLTGDWRGLFWWNVYTGETTALAAILFLFRLAGLKHQRWYVNLYGLIFYALSIFLILKTRSATELLALLAAHGVFVLAFLYTRWGHLLKRVHWVGAGVMGLVILSGLWFGRNFLLGLMGRSSDLTGRVPLWIALIPYIQNRFWLGYGFGEAFWKISQYTQVVWKEIHWNAPWAHNGYIEAFLDTGVVGLVLWIVFILQDFYLSVRYFVHEHVLSACMFAAWITYIVVSNLAANMLGTYEYFTWFLLTITFALLVRERLDQKQPVPIETSKTS